MITGIIVAAVVVGCVGIILGFFLGIAGEKFKVETDPREDAILEVLPGNNCGGCGYAGCSGLAAAIAKGEAPVNQCPVGGEPVAAKVGEIMGVSAGASVKKVAFVKCAGTCEKAKQDYEYTGVEDCAAILAPFKARAEMGELVEISEIAKEYQRAVDHPVSNGQIYFVLRRHGWRKVMPRSRHPQKASEEEIAASKKLITP